MSVPSVRTSHGRLSFSRLPSEVRLTLLLFLFSFLISGIPRVYTQTAAHTLFISAYGAAALPWAYLAQALCVPIAGFLYIRGERSLKLPGLMVGTLVLQAMCLTLFRIGVALHIPLVAIASIIYFEIEFVLSSLLLWGLANQLMTLRQGKRLFGFVSAGEPVAIIICGLSTPLVLRWLGPADLFLLSAMGISLGIVLVLYILRHHRPADSVTEAEPEEQASPDRQGWWKDSYICTMVCLVAVGQFAYYFVDNAFYVEAGKQYPTEESLASFLGIYSGIVGMVSLTCSVLITRLVLKRFGVRGGLLTLPVLLMIGTTAALVAAMVRGTSVLLFLLVVGNKVIDQSFRYTVDKTTFVTLFQPLPARQRMRVQAGLESIVEPITGGIAGLLLFLMINALGFGAMGITGAVLFVACLWTGLVAVQYRGYLGSLRSALAGRGVSTQLIRLDDDESRTILLQRLWSNRAGEVLYCLSLMDSLELALDPIEATRLLQHESREVRSEIARRLKCGPLRLPGTALRNAIAAESDAQVKYTLIEILAATEQDILAEFSNWLDDPEESVRLGAAVGLIRHGGIEGVLKVGPRLLQDLSSSDPDRRRYAALLMGRAGSENFYRPLITLLRDRNPTVAREALRAAGMVAAPKLWPVMIGLLAQPELERSAIAALAAVGDPVLPTLDALWERDNLDASRRSALVSVYAGIATAAADARLAHHLQTTLGLVRHRALSVLWRRGYRCHPDYAERIRGLVNDEVGAATAAIQAWSCLQQQDDDQRVELVRRILADEVTRCIDNCFYLLSLLITRIDMHEAHASYIKGGPVRRSYVLEMLDNTLDKALKATLFPLLEPDSMQTRAAQFAKSSAKANFSDNHAHLICLAGDMHFTPLLRASAAYAASDAGAQISHLETGCDSVMSETVEWIRAGCPSLKERNMMLTIEKVLVLKSVTFFSAVQEEYLVRAAASAREVRLTAGQRLFEEGEIGTSLYVIVSGRLEVTANGKRVAEVRERDVVGEMAALDPEPRSATVTALEDSLLLKLTTEDLDLMMSEDVDVARGIIQTLCRRLRNVLTDSATSTQQQ